MSKRLLLNLLAALLLSFGVTACTDDDDEIPEPDPAPLIPSVPDSTFSIGGTVVGSSASLTLQNSNGTTVAVAASGAFSFATQMVAGASYNVTVAVPPASQTCTVANGSGTVGAANITNVAVTCTSNNLTLGGTVSGLGAGKSVVLRAEADFVFGDVTVSANGAFTFPLTFINNGEYLVSVATQPVDQTCTVENGHGDITAPVTNIAVTCINSSASAREWGTPTALAADADPMDANTFRAPKVAFDAAGNALAIWEQDRDNAGGSEIHFSRYTAGGAWSAPATIPNQATPVPGQPNTSTRRKPQLAVAANGNAVAAWVESVYGVAVSLYTPSTGWSNPELIFGNLVTGLGGTIDPKVAIDASGNVLVVWENNMVNGGRHVQYNRYAPGTGWTAAPSVRRLVNDLQFAASEPELAMLPNGTAITMWLQGGGGGFDQHRVWSSRYDLVADSWSAPQAVDTHDTANALYGRQTLLGKSLLLDAAGTATAIWSQYDGTHLHIVFNRMTGNSWGTPAIVETANDTLLSNAFDVRATIDGSGDIMAMWRQNDLDNGHYVANRYVPGTGWGTQVNIGQWVPVGHVADSSDYELVGNAAGHTVAVWTLVSGIGAENVPFPVYLSANEYNPVNNAWGAEEVIDRTAEYPGEVTGDAMSPAVAVDAAGNAFAVWMQGNASEQGIRQNRFE